MQIIVRAVGLACLANAMDQNKHAISARRAEAHPFVQDSLEREWLLRQDQRPAGDPAHATILTAQPSQGIFSETRGIDNKLLFIVHALHTVVLPRIRYESLPLGSGERELQWDCLAKKERSLRGRDDQLCTASLMCLELPPLRREGILRRCRSVGQQHGSKQHL